MSLGASLGPQASSPGSSFREWLKTTGGVVLMLLFVQFATGLLLAFYYVPSVDHAHTTVTFIEKVVSSGSWIRSLHHYGSQWLSLFAFLHVIQLWATKAYKERRVSWVASVLLLGLVMSAGATGYSLPWDARAFFSTRIAEGLLGGLPFVGRVSRLWLLAGNDISTLTLSRFFALHVLLTPFCILLVIGWLLVKQKNFAVQRIVLTRNAFVALVVFATLAIFAVKYDAPLGPTVSEATADYLPRPGIQFRWLYETLKLIPGGLGSMVGLVIPGIGLLLLLLAPWLDRPWITRRFSRAQALIPPLVLVIAAVWITSMTARSYLGDQYDPRTRGVLALQEDQEATVRRAPFEHSLIRLTNDQLTSEKSSSSDTPAAYIKWCVNCHGPRGEGAQQGGLKYPSIIGVGSKPRRSVDDLVLLLKDPSAFGLQPPMRSFADKMNEQEMREVAEWILKLK